MAHSVLSQKKTNKSTPTISAADSLTQALGLATIPPPSPPPPATATREETNERPNTTSTVQSSANTTTTSGRQSATTDSIAEAFGFETTPEDIENLIELMGPSSSNWK